MSGASEPVNGVALVSADPALEYARAAVQVCEHWVAHRRDELVRECLPSIVNGIAALGPGAGNPLADDTYVLIGALRKTVDAGTDDERRAWGNAAAAIAQALRVAIFRRELN